MYKIHQNAQTDIEVEKMKRRIKLKSYVVPSICAVLITLFLISAVQTFEEAPLLEEDVKYVSSVILSNETPVISIPGKDIVIIKPYNDNKVTIGKGYYDYKSDEQNQQNALVHYENTYIQNSGIDYVKKELFDVISILDGTVISVNNNELLGQTIEIQHTGNFISVYQSLSNVIVKEGDSVKQGDIIGSSGTCKLNIELGNHLHFELFKEGQVVNPTDYYNKNIKDL